MQNEIATPNYQQVKSTVKVLAEFTNKEDGVHTYVFQGAKGFHVVVVDTDADQIFPIINIWPDMDVAIEDAKNIANCN